MLQYFGHGIGEGHGIVRIHKTPGSVVHSFCWATRTHRHDRTSASHCFDHYDAEGLEMARKNEEVRGVHFVADPHLITSSQENDSAREIRRSSTRR